MMFNSTVVGASHLEIGKECQDCSATWQNRSGSIKIAAVSDGHGGNAYYNSALGARLACRAAVDALKEVAASVNRVPHDREKAFLKTICCSVIARWNRAVDGIRGTDPETSFGCTLIAYLQTPEYWLGLQIGDGKFAIYNSDNEWEQPIPWDDRCILNYTTSLCDDAALTEFRCAFGVEAPDAVFLSSDGIDSTFNDGELMYNFYNQVLLSAFKDGCKRIRQELPEALAHFSKIGSRDDMSLAVIINDK